MSRGAHHVPDHATQITPHRFIHHRRTIRCVLGDTAGGSADDMAELIAL
jgi:hypothetical protein